MANNQPRVVPSRWQMTTWPEIRHLDVSWRPGDSSLVPVALVTGVIYPCVSRARTATLTLDL